MSIAMIGEGGGEGMVSGGEMEGENKHSTMNGGMEEENDDRQRYHDNNGVHQQSAMNDHHRQFIDGDGGGDDIDDPDADRGRGRGRDRSENNNGVGGGEGLSDGGVQRYYIRMRGLPFGTTVDDIKTFFSSPLSESAGADHGGAVGEENGAGKDVVLGLDLSSASYEILLNESGRQRGDALIGFLNRSDQELSLKKNLHYIGHRYIEILSISDDDATALRRIGGPVRGGGRGGAERRNYQPRGLVVRLRGVPWDCKENDIGSFLGDCSLLEVHMPFDYMGRPSGECYVEVENEEMLQRVFGHNKQSMRSATGNKERFIEIFHATPAELSSAMNFSSGHGGGGGYGRGGGSGRGGYSGGGYGRGRRDFDDRRGGGGGAGYYDRRGDDYDKEYVIHDRDRGDRDHFRGRDRDRDRDRDRYHDSYRSRRHSRSRSRSPMPSYSVSSSSMPSSSSSSASSNSGEDLHPDSSCLRIRGLPFSASDNDILTFFRSVDVIPIRIHREGSSRGGGGEAYVEFANANDKRLALRKNRGYLGSRYLELFSVSYDSMMETVYGGGHRSRRKHRSHSRERSTRYSTTTVTSIHSPPANYSAPNYVPPPAPYPGYAPYPYPTGESASHYYPPSSHYYNYPPPATSYPSYR